VLLKSLFHPQALEPLELPHEWDLGTETSIYSDDLVVEVRITSMSPSLLMVYTGRYDKGVAGENL